MNVHAQGEEAPNLAAIENTMAAVFPSVLRVPHYVDDGYLLLARRGDVAIDPSRLVPVRIQRRFSRGAASPAEWEELLQLADDVRRSILRSGPAVTATPGARVLTDDHAPLEWLTDRFLRASEATARGGDDVRSQALADLRGKQRRLLLLVALAWAAVLAAAGTHARASGSRRGRDGPAPRHDASRPG
jgi:hypothetical protein